MARVRAVRRPKKKPKTITVSPDALITQKVITMMIILVMNQETLVSGWNSQLTIFTADDN